MNRRKQINVARPHFFKQRLRRSQTNQQPQVQLREMDLLDQLALGSDELHQQHHDRASAPISTPEIATPQAVIPQPDSSYLIDMRQIFKSYETPAGSFTALKGVDLTVDTGEFAAVIGKSGSGKSTLINMLTGIDRPTYGEIYVAGTAIHKLNEREMARWRGLNVGIIFQFFQLFPTLTLVENVMMPMEFCNLYTLRERRERAMYLLDLVQIAEQAHKLPSMISGGQQQRVAIARSLANDPAILIADEPTGSLDSRTADTIFQLFEDLVAQGKTLLMVTHDQGLASRVNRVILIADGQMIDPSITSALPNIDNRQLIEISSQLTSTTHAANSVIYHEGDAADAFYIIIKGEIQMTKRHRGSGNVEQIVLTTLGSGQFFGEIELLQKGTRMETAMAGADSDVVLMHLERKTFTALLNDSQLTHDAVARLMRQRITTHHLLDILPDKQQGALIEQKLAYETLTYQPGEIIFQQGDLSDRFYLIIKGEVEILHPHREKSSIVKFESGQYFGETGLQRGGRRSRTVRVAPESRHEVELIAIEQETFQQLVNQDKMVKEEIALAMHQHVAERLEEFLPNMRRRARVSSVVQNLTFDD